MGAGAVDYSRLHHQNMHMRSVHAVVDEQKANAAQAMELC